MPWRENVHDVFRAARPAILNRHSSGFRLKMVPTGDVAHRTPSIRVTGRMRTSARPTLAHAPRHPARCRHLSTWGKTAESVRNSSGSACLDAPGLTNEAETGEVGRRKSHLLPTAPI